MTSMIIMIITILSKIAGLAREKVLATLYGTSPLAEAFITAFAIPIFFMTLFSAAIAAGYIPLYNEAKVEGGKKRADLFTAKLINISFIIGLALTVLGFIFTVPLVKIFAKGFEGEQLTTTVQLTKWGLLSLSITTVAAIIRSYLQIHDRFGVSVSQGLLMNGILIATLFVASQHGVTYLGLGLFLATTLQYVIYVPGTVKLGYRHSLQVTPLDPKLHEFFKLIVPIFIAVSVNELNIIINRSMASTVVAGGVAAINYGFRLQTFVTGIVVTAIVTAIYPKLSQEAANEQLEAMEETVLSSVTTMSLLVIPATVGLVIFAEPIVRLLFYGGAFGDEALMMTKNVLAAYSLGMLPLGIREIAVRICYAKQDMKTPVLNALLMVCVNFVAGLCGKQLGVHGLALGMAFATAVGAILLLVSIQKRIMKVQWGRIWRDHVKIILATLVMALASTVVYKHFMPSWGENKSFLVAAVVALLVYGAMVFLLRVEEVHRIRRRPAKSEEDHQ